MISTILQYIDQFNSENNEIVEIYLFNYVAKSCNI